MKKNKYFGAMIDCSRNGVMKPEKIVEFAEILKSFGYNMMQLYTEDTYEVDGEPYFGYMRGKYSQEELKYICKKCEEIGVEIIPCIQTLAHLNQIFRWPYVYENIHDANDVLLVGEERTYELIENMIKSLRKCFTSEYIHIGMDEAFFVGRGKYIDKNGYKERSEILKKHLERVALIAQKYEFKPLIWSDMFYTLASGGKYYEPNIEINDVVKNSIPENVELVYWDYYNDKKEIFDGMFASHKKFGKTLWFAGAAWSWVGFASGNKKSLQTMLPAMKSARENGIENIFITMWGDDGKECSFYSLLPTLYAVKRFYDGETDMDKIKSEFYDVIGERFDDILKLDLPNYVGGNEDCAWNVSKYMFYCDTFNGFFDSSCRNGVAEEYRNHAKILKQLSVKSKYGYLFESASALCEVLAIKYDLGVRTRTAYKSNNKAELQQIIKDYEKTINKVNEFYEKFRILWFKENKANGFDVQDQRFGGLLMRLTDCRRRLIEFTEEKTKKIEELEEEILDYFGNGKDYKKDELPCFQGWALNVSCNRI